MPKSEPRVCTGTCTSNLLKNILKVYLWSFRKCSICGVSEILSVLAMLELNKNVHFLTVQNKFVY